MLLKSRNGVLKKGESERTEEEITGKKRRKGHDVRMKTRKQN